MPRGASKLSEKTFVSPSILRMSAETGSFGRGSNPFEGLLHCFKDDRGEMHSLQNTDKTHELTDTLVGRIEIKSMDWKVR